MCGHRGPGVTIMTMADGQATRPGERLPLLALGVGVGGVLLSVAAFGFGLRWTGREMHDAALREALGHGRTSLVRDVHMRPVIPNAPACVLAAGTPIGDAAEGANPREVRVTTAGDARATASNGCGPGVTGTVAYDDLLDLSAATHELSPGGAVMRRPGA